MTLTSDFVHPGALQRVDGRAQRIQAKAEAELTQVETEHRRRQLQLQHAQDQADAKRRDDQARRDEKATARKRRAQSVRSFGAALPDVARAVSCISPTAIATRGQLAFGRDVMHLGVMAPLLPLMLEGAAWSVAWKRQQALRAGEPTGRLTLGVWALALIAAGMNFWHGMADSLQVGVAYALASLVGFAMIELFASHTRGARAGITRRPWLLRAVRYPGVAWSAFSLHIAFGPGVDPERAWNQAWRDRFDCDPGSTARMRDHGRRRVQQDRAAAPLTAIEARTDISPTPAPARPTRTRKTKVKTTRARTDEQLLEDIRQWAAANGRLPGRNELCRVFGVGDTRAGRLLREVRVAS